MVAVDTVFPTLRLRVNRLFVTNAMLLFTTLLLDTIEVATVDRVRRNALIRLTKGEDVVDVVTNFIV